MAQEDTYQSPASCNKCGTRANSRTQPHYEQGYLVECNTRCSSCGHEDTWAYGFFVSNGTLEKSKAAKYAFGEDSFGI